MKITWSTDVNAPCCPGEILPGRARRGMDRGILIQTDWEYPSVAQTFGWSLRDVQKARRDGDFDWGRNAAFSSVTNAILLSIRWKSKMMSVPNAANIAAGFKACDHDATDGTVDCKACGVTASEFISAAYDWLIANDGATADDPGYF